MRRLALLLGLALLACGKQAAVGVGPSPSTFESPSAAASATVIPGASSFRPQPSASPRATGTDQEWTLRYLLLDHYPNLAYCDPDYYPIARVGGEQANADDWWSRNRTTPEARAILAHTRYAEPLDAEQRLTAYRDHKKLTVIQMTRITGNYEFTLSISTLDGGLPDATVNGTISDAGTVSERSRSPRPGGCPICLEGVTGIATPNGAVEVSRIRPGDLVYSVDASGRSVTVSVARVARRETPGPHLMVRLALTDGRVLVAAGTHPTGDGRPLRDLLPGERYDASAILSIDYVESSAPATYDILPAGASGEYWANGILVGSTLARPWLP